MDEDDLQQAIVLLAQSAGSAECCEQLLQMMERRWVDLVPDIYRLPEASELTPSYDEERAARQLLDPLLWFVTGNAEPQPLLERLKSASTPPQLCGRMFKPGEPNYSCRECSADNTCVMCVDCFKNSVHRNHRYKICSSASGYCDCGDVEAWKRDPICAVHSRQHQQSLELAMANVVPDDQMEAMAGRLRVVLQLVLEYAYLVLKWNGSQLPDRLRPSGSGGGESSVVVLYNDETHTYEHVIHALIKSIKCDNKQATEYATAVDREGRRVIYHGPEERCRQVAVIITDTTRKNSDRVLEVKVMTEAVVAHQTFAVRLLSWLMEQLLPVCARFREEAARFLCQPGHRFARYEPATALAIDQDGLSGLPSLAEKIMCADTAFWKSIRVLWHQLFMSALLLELEPKKQFARLYCRNYGRMLRDYINDDHEHRVSVLSLSVQIFTVPSIAAILVEEEGALAALGDAFLSLNWTYHKTGRFKFDMAPNMLPNPVPFKRSHTALIDLQFLLTRPGGADPTCWTEPMRRQFVSGAESFCKLLKRMQNMDSIIRQVVQHIEYEPGWDTGIKFESRVRPLIKLVVDWAVTDRAVYVAVLNVALRLARDSFEFYANAGDRQNTNPLTNSQCTTVRRHYADRSAMVWHYNVGRKEISIHTPLSRFVAALLLHLPRHGLWDEYLDCGGGVGHGAGNRPSELTAHRLNPESMMELALRTQVLLGQFRAGMWRRNGYSLINQINHYQGPQLRQTAYDLDILTLQLAAAMIDPNEFMIHLMYKYNVDRMLEEQPAAAAGADSPTKRNDDSTRHQITLLEEFLRLIYTILVERYTVGLGAVTAEQCVQNEVIQWLCKESMSHSDLLARMAIWDGDEHWIDLEELILQVADFQPSTSSSNTAGRYVLKKPYYERFNPFFYHYTRQDQSAAFESKLQRWKREAATARSGGAGGGGGKMATNGHGCCPPPPLPDFVEPYQAINEILLCDVTLAIIKTILDKTINLKDIYFSDFQFQQCLYLIGIGLNEESKRPDRFRFSQKAIDCGIVSLLEQCSSRHIMARVEMHQGLYEWCLDRFKQVMMGADSASGSGSGASGSPTAADDVELGRPAADEDPEQERNRRRKMAAARKERILQQMQRQQRSFMKENEKYFKENLSQQQQQQPQEKLSLSDSKIKEANEEEDPVALGPGRRVTGFAAETYTCILCLESQDVNANNGRYLVLAGFIQRSTVLSKSRGLKQAWNEENVNCVWVPGADHNFGPFVNTCTHCMHHDCYDKYIETSAANERRRAAHRYQRITFDLTKREFLCPLCECLCNLTIPIMPVLPVAADLGPGAEISMDQWLSGMLALLQNCATIWVNEPDQLATLANKGFNKSFCELMAAASPGGPSSLPDELRCQLERLQSEYQAHGQRRIDSDAVLRDLRNKLVECFYGTVYRVTKSDGAQVAKPEPLEMVQCLNWAISYTIHVLERTMRVDAPICLADLVDTRQHQCLKALVSLVRAQLNFVQDDHPRRIFLHLMNYLLVSTVYLSSPYHLLELDAFSLLVSLVVCAPAFFAADDEEHAVRSLALTDNGQRTHFVLPLANGVDKSLVELALTFHLVQIILTNGQLRDGSEPMEVDSGVTAPDDADSFKVAQFCKDVLIAAGHRFSEPKLISGAGQLAATLKLHLVPFLRCAALLVYFLTGTRWPRRLWQKAAADKDGAAGQPVTAEEEYLLLCHYLAIDSSLGFVWQSANLRLLALSWPRHHKLSTLFVRDGPEPAAVTVLRHEWQCLEQPHSLNRLIDLPHDFSDLINSVANFTCPNSNGEESRSPTMCLICGEVLCSQNYCCQRRIGARKELVGACTYHSQQCSASVGIFLRIRDNKILLLTSRGRGCYLPSPYLDKYGETDSGLFRGDPMFLSRTAYEQLYRLWLRHGIPEQIVHLMETSNSLASVNWNIM